MEKLTRTLGEPAVSVLLHAKAAANHIPLSGTFELTSRCNLHCKMCYICGKKHYELTAEQWITLGARTKEQGMVFLLLTGGEPLMHPEFDEIYTAFASMGFVLSVNTNGTLLHKKIDLFRACPPSRLNVSLYGASDETYTALCGAPMFDRVLRNIDTVRDMGIDVRANCTLTPFNAKDIEKVHALCAERNIPLKTATYLYPPVRRTPDAYGCNTGRFSPEQAAQMRMVCNRLRLDKQAFHAQAQALWDGTLQTRICPDDEAHCRAGVTAFWIDCKGGMHACGMLSDTPADTLTEPFDVCWKKVQTFAAAIRMPKACGICRYRGFCGVCPAACKSETGSFTEAPDYLCKMSAQTASLVREYLSKGGRT